MSCGARRKRLPSPRRRIRAFPGPDGDPRTVRPVGQAGHGLTIAGRAWHNAKRMLTECLPTKMDARRALVADDIADVDRLIKLRLYSEVALINQLSHYIVASGGKRLRPVLPVRAALGVRRRPSDTS